MACIKKKITSFSFPPALHGYMHGYCIFQQGQDAAAESAGTRVGSQLQTQAQGPRDSGYFTVLSIKGESIGVRFVWVWYSFGFGYCKAEGTLPHTPAVHGSRPRLTVPFLASLRALAVTGCGKELVVLVFLLHIVLFHDSVCTCGVPRIGCLVKRTLNLLRFLSFLRQKLSLLHRAE